MKQDANQKTKQSALRYLQEYFTSDIGVRIVESLLQNSGKLRK